MNPCIFIRNGELVIILNKSKWYYSIKWKLFISFFFISLIPLLFFSNTVVRTLEKSYIDERQRDILRQANIIAGHVYIGNYLLDESKKNVFDYYLEQTSKEGSFRIIVIDGNGMVLNDSNKTEIGKFYVIPEVLEALDKKDVAKAKSNKTINAAASIVNDSSEKIGVVLITAPIEDIFELLKSIQTSLFLLTIITTLIVVVFVFLLSQLLIDPLKNILKVVQKMSDGHLSERIKVSGHDEYFELAEAFNTMAERLGEVDSSRQEFVSNVSHELKTPLSSIKVLSESVLLQDSAPIEIYKEFLQDINSEVDRMAYIINDLLTLVKLDQREIPINFKERSVNKIVEDILKRLFPIAEQKKIELLYERVRDVTADCDEMKLSLAISNLVENGIKYTPVNGSVKVIVDADHQNAFITIQDTGIGISEEDQGKVFSRFYRVDKTRDRETGGTGLGLSITHSTILIHNGSIKLSSKENEGSTFVIRIPLHQQSL